jgi:hypothetical protein
MHILFNIQNIKIYNWNVYKFAPTRFGPFGPSSGSLWESKDHHELPEDGPNGPKHVGANV